MLRISAITAGRFDPSSRFRIRQYIPLLGKADIEVRECCPPINIYSKIPLCPENVKMNSYNLPIFLIWQSIKLSARIPHILGTWRNHITWLSRFLVPGHLSLEPLLKTPLVFDVDDSIWLLGPFARKAAVSIAERCEVILAGNDYIASWFEPHTHSIRVVPSAVDTEKYNIQSDGATRKSERFVIGWIGSSSNLPYLKIIEPCLRSFLINHPDSEFLVVCDKPLQFETFPLNQIKYIPWSENIEADAIKRMNVGVMPLPDDDWTRGKCSYKMLQYMACGVPVIVSPVGMNREVLAKGTFGKAAQSHSEWYEAFSFYYGNESIANTHGREGRNVVEQYYSVQLITRQLADIFKSLL
jgi:glycosyltransferase involved in cell wall biosynthesis